MHCGSVLEKYARTSQAAIGFDRSLWWGFNYYGSDERAISGILAEVASPDYNIQIIRDGKTIRDVDPDYTSRERAKFIPLRDDANPPIGLAKVRKELREDRSAYWNTGTVLYRPRIYLDEKFIYRVGFDILAPGFDYPYLHVIDGRLIDSSRP